MGTGGQPFPHAKQTQAQRAEDTFMQIHGGAGSRLIYRLVSILSNLPDFLSRLLRPVVNNDTRKPRSNRAPLPHNGLGRPLPGSVNQTAQPDQSGA